MSHGFANLARLPLALTLLVCLGVLSACDNAEERAEQHFQSALELIEAGDVERAIVEFRNVFKLNGTHREARATYAALQRNRGDYREAIGQYLRLVEQYPDDVEANLALAELYAEIGNWNEMDRFVTALQEHDPDNIKTKALGAILAYRTAVENRDQPAASAAAKNAVALLDDLPDEIMLRQVIVDDHIRSSDFEAALAELDRIVENQPDDPAVYAVRLSVLGALGDGLAIEEQLKDNIERFPEDSTYRTALVRFYVSQQQNDLAEAILREDIAANPGDLAPKLTLVRFLTELKGLEEALSELDRMIAAGTDEPVLATLRAGIRFETGERQAAIAEQEGLIARLEDAEDAHEAQVALVRMYIETGDTSAARELTRKILSEDPSNVAALKMNADWLIDEDKTGDAIAALRTALDQAPQDAEIFTLLARAHGRDGNHELVGEMLALAVEAADQAPEQSVRYARYLLTNDKIGPAEATLIDALRRAPTNGDLLATLGDTYLLMREWGRLEQVIATLHNLPGGQGQMSANDLQARMLQAQARGDEALAFLQQLVDQGQAGFDADLAIVRTNLANAEPQKAKDYVTVQLAERGNDRGLLFLDAAIDGIMGRVDDAVATYRTLLEEDDQEIRVWLGLYRVMNDHGRQQEADRVAAEALAAVPNAVTLQWIQASILERDGDIDGAIALYEKMYAAESDNLIVANNLASLLIQRAEDPDTVARAYAIARRLRSSDVPHYQDTYGWLAYLRGDHVQAIRFLEPAALALTHDPMVQYHLAAAYAGANQLQKAHQQFSAVVAMLEDGDTRDFAVKARAELDRLSKLPELAGSQ